MNGQYRFYKHGKLILASKNLITNYGKRAMLDYLAGYSTAFISDIAVGVGSAAAQVTDYALQFEVEKATVIVKSPNYATSEIIHKATFSGPEVFTIHEVAACAPGFGNDSFVFMDFNDQWSAGTFTTSGSRYGVGLQLTAGPSATVTSEMTDIFLDFSQYFNSDKFVLAGMANNAFVSNVRVQFRNDASNYFQMQFNSPTSGNYTTFIADKSSLTKTGSPDWSSITSMVVSVTSTAGGSGSFLFDAIRIQTNAQQVEQNVLVSRSVLGSPVSKEAGVPLEVEYAITI